MTEQSSADRFAVFLGTGFGIGFAPRAPGTFGSLLGPPLVIGLQQAALSGFVLALIGTVFVLIGIPICTKAAKALGRHDPGQVVYDEIAAFWIVFLPQLASGHTITWQDGVIGFLAFRVFDIAKPWPVKRFENLPDGTGIMADDLVAGCYAAVCVLIIQSLIGP